MEEELQQLKKDYETLKEDYKKLEEEDINYRKEAYEIIEELSDKCRDLCNDKETLVKKHIEDLTEIKTYVRKVMKMNSSVDSVVLTCIENNEEVLKDILKSQDTGSLSTFLKSDQVIIDPNLYCRQRVFVASFNDFCKENHFFSSKWTSQYYSGPFANYDIKVVPNTRKRYPNTPGSKTYTENFIYGLDIKNMDGKYDDYE